MRYFEAFKYLFTNPNWPMALLIASLCQLVPIVGLMVLIGYIGEALANQGAGAPCPDFRFDRLGDYLMRGLWPFLAVMVVGLAMMMALAAVVFVPLILIPALDLRDGAAAAVIVLAVALALPVWVLTMVAGIPVFLRSFLMRDFADGFSWAFAREFLARVWFEALLSVLFVFLMMFPLTCAGYLLCLVGVYPAMAIGIVAQYHLFFQLYELYLVRGGTPVTVVLDAQVM